LFGCRCVAANEDGNTPDEIIINGQLVSLGWQWCDGKQYRYSQGTNLISGIEIDKEGIVQSRVQSDGQATITTMDISDSLLYDVEKYQSFFMKDGRKVYGDNHSKIVAMKEAIRNVKGDASHNKVLFVHKQSTGGLKVEKELVPQDVYGQSDQVAARALNIGTKGNPQSMVHIEAKAPSSGFWSYKNTMVDLTSRPEPEMEVDLLNGGGGGGGGSILDGGGGIRGGEQKTPYYINPPYAVVPEEEDEMSTMTNNTRNIRSNKNKRDKIKTRK
jgi:hypothetical protein